MVHPNATFGAHHSVRDVVRFHSGLFVVQGAIMVLLGVAALIWPAISSVAVSFYIGWMFLMSGAVGLGLMVFAPTAGGFFWALLTSVLTMFAGALLIWHPLAGTLSLTLVLTAFFLAEGVFQIVSAFSHRSDFPESWSWMLLSGIADLVLVALILAGWPGSAAWALGLYAGINLISSGLALIVTASTVRNAVGRAQT